MANRRAAECIAFALVALCFLVQRSSGFALDWKKPAQPETDHVALTEGIGEKVASILSAERIDCSVVFAEERGGLREMTEIKHGNMSISERLNRLDVNARLLAKETVCLLIRSESLDNGENKESQADFHLITVRYDSLVTNYPIVSSYDFAVPHFESACACDCPGGEDHCEANGPAQFGRAVCQPASDDPYSACVRTLSGRHSAAGCDDAGHDRADAVLCCDVTVAPYSGRRFAAVKLGQPSVRLVAEWSLYALANGSRQGPMRIEAEWAGDRWSAHHVTQFGRITLDIPRPEMRTALPTDEMLFYERIDKDSALSSGPSDGEVLRTGVRVQELKEHDTARLGWYRYSSSLADADVKISKASIRNQIAAIKEMHSVSVTDCKAQLFTEVFKAEQYVHTVEGKSDVTNIDLGLDVTEKYRWIENLEILHTLGHTQRRVQVGVKDASAAGVNVQVSFDLKTGSRASLHRVEHTGYIAEGAWRAVIEHSAHSEHYLHVELGPAVHGRFAGTVHLQVERLADADTQLSHRSGPQFAVYVPMARASTGHNYTMAVKLPTVAIDGDRVVCMASAVRPSGQQCVLAPFVNTPPAWSVRPHMGLQVNRGECDGCNVPEKAWFKAAWSKVKNYFSSVTSGQDTITQVIAIAPWALGLLVLLCVCAKCAQLCHGLTDCCDALCCCCRGGAGPHRTARTLRRGVSAIKRLSRLSVDGFNRASVVVLSPVRK